MPDIYLPNIIKLELTNFSLYCEQSVVMDFSKPVSCLMGANGIGKSTLLNCVNFAITGRINPTNKKLKSIDTLDRGNNYYLQYFDGRISEVDKDYASTRIVFMLGNKRIEVVRNFFPDNSILEYKLDNETQDPRNYEDDVVRLANLNNYAQFVFLQLKVLTFDESRDCLFWNPSILTPTIFLCLGESVDNAERADELAREIQKVNSRIRNVQWEISKQSARLTTLIEEKSKTEEARPHYASEDEASAQNEYEEIIKELEEGESYHQGYTKERQQIYARITELTVEKVRLRKEYEEHYAELYAGNGHLYRNPIIIFTAYENEEDIVTGLMAGADDYVTKPCSLRVLRSRIFSQLRRKQWSEEIETEIIRSGDLVIDVVHNIFKKGRELSIKDTEFRLCYMLVRNDGRIMPRELLLERLWDMDEHFIENNTLSVYVSRLRKKLGVYNGVSYIETIKGIGYRWNHLVQRGEFNE